MGWRLSCAISLAGDGRFPNSIMRCCLKAYAACIFFEFA